MYIPKQYNQADLELQIELIKHNPLGTLISVGEDGISLQATHIPFIVTEQEDETGKKYILKAHLSRANKQTADLDHESSRDPNKEYLLIFQGPHDYVTPSWYVETKPATEKVVPTWDYSSVHVYGTVKLIKDSQWILDQAAELTDQRETKFDQKWKLSDAPTSYTALKAKAIWGVEFTVNRTEASWKYSQETTLADNEGVINGFKSLGDDHGNTMAEEVTKCWHAKQAAKQES